jgi:hypothetical protein
LPLQITDIHLLADFIKTLGKSEKRFFKMSAATSEFDSANALELFDVLDKESMSTEKLEKSKLFSDAEIELLYQLLLESLKNFYAESKISFQIKDDILNLRCLIDKAQYKQSRKMLSSLKRTLYDTEEFSCLLKTFDVEKKLTAFEGAKAIQTLPQSIAGEEQSIVRKQLRIVAYHKLLIAVKQTDDSNKNTLEDFLKHPLLQEYTETQSMKERVFVLKCKQVVFTKLNRPENVHLLNTEIETIMHAHVFLNDYFKNIC